jgi:ATP-dependent exoDNAse (exonuclease V) beta subunit
MEAMGQFTTELLTQEVQKLYAAPDAKATERLQFMTIHKSKGLEFDTVILPGLDKTTGKNDQQLLIWEEVPQERAGADVADIDLVVAPLSPKGFLKSKKEPETPYAYLQSLEKQRAQYEDARVLYVAATRAERCLHLLGAVKLDKHGQASPKKNTFLEMLWPVLVPHFDTDSLLKAEQHISTDGQSPLLRLEDFAPQLVRLTKPALPAILETDTSAGVSANNGDEVAVISPSLEADIGTLTHRYLELIAKHGHHDWTPQRITSLETAMQRWLLQQGHQHLPAKQGAQTVVQLLIKTLESTDGQWLLQNRAGADQEFAQEFFDGEVKKRIIDRTFIENDVRWIIDYKTTQAVADLSEVSLTQAAREHQQQLRGYAALFKDEDLTIKTAVFFVNIGRLIEVSV